MNLCKYKNIFGKENDGVHSIRLFDVALVDLILTVVIGVVLSRYFNPLYVFLLLVVVTILIHRVFCVNTTINKVIFGVI